MIAVENNFECLQVCNLPFFHTFVFAKYWSDRRHFGVLWKVVCSEIITASDLPGTVNNVH